MKLTPLKPGPDVEPTKLEGKSKRKIRKPAEWSKEQDDELERRYYNNELWVDIARDMDVTESLCRKHSRELRVYSGRRVRWSDEDIKEFREMRASGKSWREIGKRFGCAKQTCQSAFGRRKSLLSL
jgi:hypothetical protein